MDGQARARDGGHDDARGARARGQADGHGSATGGARPGGHAPAPVPVPAAVPDGGHVGMLDDVPVPIRFVLGVLLSVMLAATGIGFLLSYESLHRLAAGHGLHGRAAWIWPSAVDSFIAIGELGTTVLIWLRHAETRWWRRIPWLFVSITGAGFAGSLAANLVGIGPDPANRLVSAVPPITALGAFAGLTYVGHALLQRWQEQAAAPPGVPVVEVQAVPVEPAPVPVPPALPAAPPAVPAPARQIAARAPARSKVVVPLPGGGDLEAERARARRMYAESMVAGTPVTVIAMMAATGKGERWCKTQRAAVGRTVEDACAYLDRIES